MVDGVHGWKWRALAIVSSGVLAVAAVVAGCSSGRGSTAGAGGGAGLGDGVIGDPGGGEPGDADWAAGDEGVPGDSAGGGDPSGDADLALGDPRGLWDGDAGAPLGAGEAVQYPDARIQSPITAEIGERLRRVGAGRGLDPRFFAKVGDSISAGWTFLFCLAHDPVLLDERDDLGAAVSWFGAGRVGGTTAFDRSSLATVVGQGVNEALAGDPSPLERELAATTPRFAVVLIGTNDVGWHEVSSYAATMWELLDRTLAAGVVPIVTTLPGRNDDAVADAQVNVFNAVLRALAQGRRLPLVNLHRALQPLPGRGLRADGVHLSADWDADLPGTCDFTPAGLRYGANVHNLAVLDAVDRLRRAVVAGEVLDAEAPVLAGDGGASSPWALTFSGAPLAQHGTLAGAAPLAVCGEAAAPAQFYELSLAGPERVRLELAHPGAADSQLQVHRAGAASPCLLTPASGAEVDLEAGRYTVVVQATQAAAGEYLLIVR